jgi:hypothetical protein
MQAFFSKGCEVSPSEAIDRKLTFDYTYKEEITVISAEGRR